MRWQQVAGVAVVTLVSGVAAASAADVTETPMPGHVRTTQEWVKAAVAKGRATSPTFRQLVEAIEASDVIAYVVPLHADMRRGSTEGFVAHQARVAGGFRYVTVAVINGGTDQRMISRLAHELQHVVEIAQHPAAGRTSSIEALFQGITGESCEVSRCYETTAAIAIQAAVLSEVADAERRRH